MYVPTPFQSSDREAILDLIEAAPFATVITTGGEPAVSHVPVSLTRSETGWGTLRGHMARGNPHWRLLDGARQSLLIFHGPHAYVSPSWYEEPAAPPTWNYAVAHAYGRPAILEGGPRTAALLDELLARYEREPLALSEAARRSLERGIVGFELAIERVEAKFKLGQNKTAADRAGTVAALEKQGDVERDLAAWTRRLTDLS